MAKTLEELYLRKRFCEVCIKTIEDVSNDDTRKVSALAEYHRQLDLINDSIKKIEQRPPDIVVGLKTATLSGRTQ